MSDQYLGEVRMFGFSFAPAGWALCNGQLLSISSNTALFSLLGTMYGGNGQTTFGLPNLQSRVAVGMGQGTGLSPYTQGQIAGSETVTLITQQLPAHQHTLNGDASVATTNIPSGANLAQPNTGSGKPPPGVPSYSMGTPSTPTQLNASSIGITGSNQPHANIQPVLAMNYCIALQGIYPTRN